MQRARFIRWLILCLALAGLGGIFYAQQVLQRWAYAPMLQEKETLVTLRPGMGLTALAIEAETQGLVSRGFWITLYVRIYKNFRKFQAGPYRILPGMSLDALLEDMQQGRTYHPLVLEFSIPEGYAAAQILARMEGLGIVQTGVASDSTFIRSLGIEGTSLEGFLYPATYRFYDQLPTETQALSRMVGEFFSRLPEDYAAQIEALGLTLVQAVNMASLIEREAFVEAEKPQISEVIWTRYQRKISLGIDATLLYGMPEGTAITTAALHNRENLYNTRVHIGLPPTPICSPSTTSLAAVLHPTKEGWLYYVLIPDGSKRHVFSRTLHEHNQHVKTLVQEQKRQRQRLRNGETGISTGKKKDIK